MPFYVENGYPVITGKDGLPLDGGYVFIGIANLNPLSNPQEAFWDEEFTVPANKIRTSGGYIVYKGSPARVHTKSAYSLLVQDENRNTVYYQPTSIDTATSGSGSAEGEPAIAGLPVGGVIPETGKEFAGYLQLGTGPHAISTYQEFFNTNLDFITNNGDGTFTLRPSGFDSGWVVNSDWTNAALLITHNIGKGLSELSSEVFVSSLGSETTSIKIIDTSFSPAVAAESEGGISGYGIDINSFQLRTGTDGLDLINTDGTKVTLTNQSWFYRVVVKRRDMPFPAQVKATEVVQGVDVLGDIPIGMSLPYPREESPSGYLVWAFDNAVSQEVYSDLYAIVGNAYEAQHIAAGDPPSSSSDFYPTPVPGDYTRAALPNITVSPADITTGSDSIITLPSSAWRGGLRSGTKYRFEVLSGAAPAGLVDQTEYYIVTTATVIKLYASESNAISDTLAIQATDVGAGVFRLTQEGVSLEDVLHGHHHEWIEGSGSAGVASLSGLDTVSTTEDGGVVGDPVEDGVNGPVATSNETRPSTVIQFMQMKAQSTGNPRGDAVDSTALVNGKYVGELFHYPVRREPSVEFPAVLLSDGDKVISEATYPFLVSQARGWKVEYKLPGSAAVDSWIVSASGTIVTFPSTTEASAILSAYVEDNAYHIRAGGLSWSHAPTITIDSIDNVITGINLGTPSVTVATAPGDGPGKTAIFYRHRIAGSTDTARLFESTGAAIHSPGDQAGEFVAGMRVRDQTQRITGKIAGSAATATVVDGMITAIDGFASDKRRIATDDILTTQRFIIDSADSDDSRASATTDGTTRSPGLVAHTYIHAGVVVA